MWRSLTSNFSRGQKGFGLIFAVSLAAVLMISLVFSSSFYFEKMLAQVSRQRNRIVALQVLQDFAVLAQRANDQWLEGGGVPACTAAAPVRFPAGKNFCWSAAPTANCVRSPVDGSNFTLGTKNVLCYDGTGTQLNLAQLRIEPPPLSAWFRIVAVYSDVIRERHFVLSELERRFVRGTSAWLSPWAGAQQKTFRPAIGAAPLNYINPIPCAVVADTANPGCKVCRGIGASTTECVELQVCTNLAGCGAIGNNLWYREVVAILPRI